MRQYGGWIGRPNTMFIEEFAWQIEAAALCVLLEIAQDVGELEGAAFGEGQLARGVTRIAERAHRQEAYGTGDPRAIELELRQGWRAEILDRIHFHAVNDREKIFAP